jgi:hypothetical protein
MFTVIEWASMAQKEARQEARQKAREAARTTNEVRKEAIRKEAMEFIKIHRRGKSKTVLNLN